MALRLLMLGRRIASATPHMVPNCLIEYDGQNAVADKFAASKL